MISSPRKATPIAAANGLKPAGAANRMLRMLPLLCVLGSELRALAPPRPEAVPSEPQPAAKRWTAAAREERVVSMEGLLRFLEKFRNDALADSMLLGLVRYYGLGFRISPDDREQLRTAGASEALVDALEAAPIHILVPPHLPPGFLSVMCQPLDCAVQVNERPVGTTSQGVLASIPVPVGEAKVRVFRQNYDVDRDEETVSIGSGNTTNLSFRLTLSRRVIESEGASLFSRVLGALGASSYPSGADDRIQASGVLDLGSRTAKPSTWSVVTTFSAMNFSRFQLSRGNRKCELAIMKHGEVSWKKRPGGREGQEIEEALRILTDYQLAAVLKLATSPSFKILAQTRNSADLDPQSLRAQADNEAYIITVDASSLPSEVALESAGLNGGTRVLYSRYADLGGFMYPRETEVVLSGGNDGVALRFDRIVCLPRASK